MKLQVSITAIIFILMLFMGVSNTQAQQWKVTTAADPMDGEKRAISYVMGEGLTSLDFPYSGMDSALKFYCDDSGDETIQVTYSSTINSTNDETKDGYNVVPVRIKIDNNLFDTKFIQMWGSNSMHMSRKHAERFIPRLSSGNVVMIEIKWHSEGRVIYSYDLNGYKSGMSKARSYCN